MTFDTPAVITLDNLPDLIGVAVGERGPDYVYEFADRANPMPCMYAVVTDDPDNPGSTTLRPSCLVGHILWQLGGVEALREIVENDDNSSSVSGALNDLSMVVVYDDDVINLLADLQAQQDQGEPWGRVADYADEVIKAKKAERAAADYLPDPAA
jgi:hypothetical protein